VSTPRMLASLIEEAVPWAIWCGDGVPQGQANLVEITLPDDTRGRQAVRRLQLPRNAACDHPARAR